MEQVNAFLGEWGLRAMDIAVPAAILFFGWIVALLLRGSTRRLMRRSRLDEKVATALLGEEGSKEVDTARWFSRFVYYVAMLLVVVAFLAQLGLSFAAEPISEFLSRLAEYAPQLIGAVALMMVAWGVARLVRRTVRGAVERTRLGQKLLEDADSDRQNVGAALSDVAYWFVFLLFLPAALGILELNGVLGPVQAMFDKMLGFLPNLLSAGVLFGVGWFAARIIQKMVASVLSAAGVDRASAKYGVDSALGERTLSSLLGLVAHILIIIPVAVAALEALELEAVTAPASALLGSLLASGPAILGAVVVLAVSYFVGRFVAGLVTSFLAGAGFDRVFVRLGLANAEPRETSQRPSVVAGQVSLIAIMLFAAMEAAGMLGFASLSGLMTEFSVVAGHVALGLVLLALGLFIGDVAARAIRGAEIKQAGLLASSARFAIAILGGAMGLRQMGLANDIIALAFGLTLGAVAVAAALAFGLGAREQAGEIVKGWRTQVADGHAPGNAPVAREHGHGAVA